VQHVCTATTGVTLPQNGMSILCACSSQRVGGMQMASQWSFPRSALA
jgi:hypothetical protein